MMDALQMKETRGEISDAQAFQADDTRDRAWMSYFRKKLLDALAGGKKTLILARNCMAASHVDLILEYYYWGWGMEVPEGRRVSLRV